MCEGCTCVPAPIPHIRGQPQVLHSHATHTPRCYSFFCELWPFRQRETTQAVHFLLVREKRLRLQGKVCLSLGMNRSNRKHSFSDTKNCAVLHWRTYVFKLVTCDLIPISLSCSFMITEIYCSTANSRNRHVPCRH
jgi:hypothetical protein